MKQIQLFVLTVILFLTSITFVKPVQAQEQYFNHGGQNIDYEAPVPTQKIPFTKNNSFPKSYDAREDGIITSIKNQNEFGTCWSYGIISAAETSLLKQGYVNDPNINLSELQVAYGFYHRKTDPFYLTSADDNKAGLPGENGYLMSGGNTYMNAMYMSQWQGVMDEEMFPNTNRYDQLLDNYDEIYQETDATYVLKEAIFVPNEIDAMKENILKYGSLIASYFSTTESNSYIYNTTRDKTNHVITIVGYDDTISKNLFYNSNDTNTLPSRDGAWIVKNSWGTSYGEDGYFYMSYDQYLSDIAAMSFQPKNNQQLYYYDGGAAVNASNYTNSSSIQFANIFEVANANEYQTEKLNAVNVGIASASTSYEIQIYQLNEQPKSPVDGTPLLTTPIQGQTTYAGLYTIPLNQEIPLAYGDVFSVVVTLKNDQSLPEIYTSYSVHLRNFVNISETIEPNQSYFFNNSQWEDCGAYYSTCARIKAITTTQIQDEEQLKTKYRNHLKEQKELQWLPQKDKLMIDNVLSQDIIEQYQKRTNQLAQKQYQYLLLKEVVEYDIYDKNQWLNNNINQISNSQKDDLNRAITNLTTLSNAAVSMDLLETSHNVLLQTYQEIENSLYDNLTVYQTLESLLVKLENFQYGPLARYLSFSQLNDIYTICYEARDIYENSQDEKDYLDQIDILKEALSTYPRIAVYNASSASLLKQLIQDLRGFNIKDTYYNDWTRKLSNASLICERNYPNKVYEAQYVRLNSYYLQSQWEKESVQLVDKTALNALIKEIDRLNAEYYTIPSWRMLQSALANAKTISTSSNVSQEDVNAIKAELEAKQKSLVNRSSLKDALDRANAKLAISEEYTDETIADLREVASYAQSVYDSEDVSYSQEEVNAQVNTVLITINALDKKHSLPIKVTNLAAEDTNYKTITLTWDASEYATSYDVYRKSYKEGAVFEYEATVEEPTYESVGVMTGKTYSFYVVAKNAAGEAQASETVEAATTLQGEVNLAIEQVSTAKFKLSWNKIDGATRYIVYRKRNDDKMLKVLTLGADATEYVTAEMPNGDYTFQVRAGRYDSKDRVMTAASNKVNGSVEALKPSVTLKAGTKSATVSWKKMEGVTHYIVYRATSDKYTKLITTKELSYTAKSLTNGKKYYFKVRGYKTYKSGTDLQYTVYTPYSSVKSVTAR